MTEEGIMYSFPHAMGLRRVRASTMAMACVVMVACPPSAQAAMRAALRASLDMGERA